MELFQLYGYDCMFGGIDYLGVYTHTHAFTRTCMHTLSLMHALIFRTRTYTHTHACTQGG